MTINQEEFFREITLRICSSLDINIALERSFEYLRQFFPLDEMFLVFLDTQLGAIRQVAHESVQEYEGPDEIIPLPKEIWDWAQGIDKPMIIDSGSKDESARAMAPLVKLEGKSALAAPLRIEGKSIGILTLRAKGDGIYREDHAALIRLVSEPFAIAPGALERLTKYDWPGNVRELQNIIERELIRYRGGVLSFESLAMDTTPKEAKPAIPAEEQQVCQPLKLDEAMALHIRKVIEHTKGRINGKDGAAELLGINPSTLRSRMEKLGVNRLDF